MKLESTNPESESKEDESGYRKSFDEVMSVFWPTVTCLYLSVSFLTFRWEWTWIIWPVAVVVKKILENTWRDS